MGTRSLHEDRACGQRGWNAHPDGSATAFGGVPGIGLSESARGPSTCGIESSSPRVYGWIAAPITSSRVPSSTTRPAYMTTTSSACSAITPRSWLTMSRAMPVSLLRRARSSRIWDCTVTSSADVGSSAISRSGPSASAIAIITRWRMPPESSCGYASMRDSGLGISTLRNNSTARVAGGPRETRSCAWIASTICQPILCIGWRDESGSWNTIAIRLPRIARSSVFGYRDEVEAVQEHLARRSRSSAIESARGR